MKALIDSGFLYAAVDKGDVNHQRVKSVLQEINDDLIMPTVILVEIIVLRWIVYRMPILTESPAWALPERMRDRVQKIFLVKEKAKEEEKEQWKVSTM